MINPKKTVVHLDINPIDLTIQCPTTMIISGQSASGKSSLILRLVKHRKAMFNVEFSKIVYTIPEKTTHLKYKFLQSLKHECPGIEIAEGLPVSLTGMFDSTVNSLWIIEDLYLQITHSKMMAEFMVELSHHASITGIISTQNVFTPGRYSVTISRQCKYRILFRDQNDSRVLINLGQAMFPRKTFFILDCMDEASKIIPLNEAKYILVDSTPFNKLPLNMRVRTCIFPDESPIFFFPK